NLTGGYVGRVFLSQESAAIVDILPVAPKPTEVLAQGSLVYVVSSNLDDFWAPLGEGIVTTVEPGGMTVFDTVSTGGENPSSAAVGNDGKLYILNTGNWVDAGSLAIMSLASRTIDTVITNMGVGPGHVAIDDNGLVYVSGFFFGTIVWDSKTKTFVRGTADPLCAPIQGGGCRGASSAAVAANGDVYQSFFGDPGAGLAPAIFVYSAGTFALKDSIAAGSGPMQIGINNFP
ncbi:MAG: hypothetical protein OEZ54_05775, partial [Gemmatimonadota bacterium]|nr:hypothetical protein [Gemmatimonadota bacterium]